MDVSAQLSAVVCGIFVGGGEDWWWTSECVCSLWVRNARSGNY